MLDKQIIMASFFSKTTDDSSKKKLFVMFSNYYFNKWDKPTPSDDKNIAFMTAMAGLSVSLVKITSLLITSLLITSLLITSLLITSLLINPLYFYLFSDCCMNNVCFSFNKQCDTKCSRCYIITCNECKTDITHRLLCKQLSLKK
jgi:hypothetical protein